MTFDLFSKIKILTGHANIDVLYGTYIDRETALAALMPKTIRKPGRTVGIVEDGSVIEYWFKDGIEDSDLILKQPVVDAYTKIETDAKFINVNSETSTILLQPTLTGNVLTLTYKGETGDVQTQTVDLSGLATIDIHIDDASYNASTNILKLTDTAGTEYSVDLSEFSILTSTDVNGVTTLTQEEVTKLTVSKVGQTGEYADLLNKPTIPAPVNISNKLDKPTTDGTWAVQKSGATITYVAVSGDNISTANLTSVAGAGMTLGAPYVWSTANQPFSITGLPDKSADATFDRFKVQNSTGVEAVVANPFQIMKKGLTIMTQAQALELGQLLNGGSGSAGAMSVNLISPPIVQKIDSIEYILLRGLNLNLNATSFKVEILDAVTGAVVVVIPNQQIQLDTTGKFLVFYYNFKDFSIKDYKIRLTSGVKVFTTTLSISVVDQVTNINLDTISWDIVNDVRTPLTPDDVGVGRNLSLVTPIGADMVGAIPKKVAKSSQLFAQGEDFYLELKVDIGDKNWRGQDLNQTLIGIGYSTSVNSLSNNALVNLGYAVTYNPEIIGYNNGISMGIVNSPKSYTVVIIKTGNLFRTIIDNYNNQTVLSNNSGYCIFVSLVGREINRSQELQVQVIKAYTFN